MTRAILIRQIPLLILSLLMISCQSSLVKTQAIRPNQRSLNDQAVSVMSFNIRYGTAKDGSNAWNHRKQAVYDMIRDQAPQIIGVQEALPFQLTELTGELSRYQSVGEGRRGKNRGEHSPILFDSTQFELGESGTFWFSETPSVAGSRDWGNKKPRICTWAHRVNRVSGRGLYVYNVHLDHWSRTSRKKSVQLLAARIRTRRFDDPVVVTGDFNAGEKAPSIRYLMNPMVDNYDGGEIAMNPFPLVDTYRAVNPDKAFSGTLHLFSGLKWGKKIDFVFSSPELSVLDARIIHDRPYGKYPSDHFPVIATVGLPKAQAGERMVKRERVEDGKKLMMERYR
ncbi:MAG: endonuclease/exonuclease/phosphatase family protein [Chitinivibrionales bacterium]